jgi:hypothetical protein
MDIKVKQGAPTVDGSGTSKRKAGSIASTQTTAVARRRSAEQAGDSGNIRRGSW